MADAEVTLWFGDAGMRLDRDGNVYSVSKANSRRDPRWVEPDLVAIYQSVLSKLGVSVEVQEFEEPDFRTGDLRCRVLHSITSNGGWLPRLQESYAYEYLKERPRRSNHVSLIKD